MNHFKTLHIFLTLLVSFSLSAQKVLDYDTYYKMVLSYHPVVKQANLLDEMSKQEIRTAKGSFDPKFDFDFTSKTYGGKKYFEYIDYGLKIPTWIGADIKLGYENNTGLNKNPFDYTPPGGLLFAGIEMPLNSVVFDERRALVRQAQNIKNINNAEKIKNINKILLSASKDYWEWFFAYHKYTTKQESYQIAKETFKAVRGGIVGGDFANIDSVEANMNLQERNIDLIDALNEYQKASYDLSLNLWTDNTDPLELEDGTVPEQLPSQYTPADTILENYIQNARSSQPELLKMNYKISKLEIDKKMYVQSMIPNVLFSLKYLSSPNTVSFEDANIPYWTNNHKLGIHLVQPLFLRKERGKYRMAQVKIDQTIFEQKILKRDIENSVKLTHNDLINYITLYKMQRDMYLSTERMFEAEKTKFSYGEATLFYLNIRQSKMLESRIKTYSYYAKLRKSEAMLNWISGIRK